MEGSRRAYQHLLSKAEYVSAKRESQVRAKHAHRRESSHLVVGGIKGGFGEEVVLSFLVQESSGNSQQFSLGRPQLVLVSGSGGLDRQVLIRALNPG